MKKIFNKRENKGITTMTVVISVIILIILASIGINLSVSENGIIKKSKKIVNGMDYSSQLQANETNRIVTGLEDDGRKYLRTTLLVTPESASKVKEINLKIAVSNKDKVTVKTSNKYQYYVSTSEDKLQGGQWLDYKLGTPFTIKNITGKRYVFVKQLTDTDGVVTITKGTTVTIDGVQYQRFGEYGFDNNAPTNTAPQIILASTKTIVIENKQTDDEGQLKTVVYEIKKTTDPDDGWKGQDSGRFENLDENTEYQVRTVATDEAGNTSESVVVTVRTTGIPGPESIKSAQNPAGWTNTDRELTISTTVKGYKLETSKDGKNWIKTENQKTYNYGDKVYARLTDGTNFGEQFVFEELQIDKQAPTDTAPIATSTTGSVTVTCTQKDEGSGEDKTKSASGIDTTKTQYRLVTDTTGKTALKDWQNSNVFEGLTHNTNYYVQTQVTDKAGNTRISNVTTLKTQEVPNGNTMGVIILEADHTKWTNTDVVVTAKTNKTGFVIQMSTDGKTFKDGNKVTLTQNGTVYARLRDASNNYGGAASKSISIIDKTAPTFTATIQNVSSSGYDVIIKDVADVGSGIDRVQVPTWTEANGQDDIQSSWATNTSVSATKQLDGTYKYRVNVIDHNNENGKYNSHVYIYDKVGNQKAIELTATVPAVSITWNSNGGSTVTATSGKAGDAIGTLPTTTRIGYTFNGWYTAATGGTQISQDTIVPVNDITYYAQWTIINYKISYTLNGGTVTGNPTSYNVESETVILKNPTKAGYNFTGWTGSNGETAQTTVTIPTGNTGNKNYTAHFEKTITLTQKHGGSSTTTQSYTLKDSETQHTFSLGNSNVSYSGWTFKGWTNGATAKAPDYTSTITISDSKTVYATFSRTYTATFIDYNGTSQRTITRSAIAYGNGSAGGVENQYGSISIPSQGTYTDWTSKGWSTGTEGNSNSITPISQNLSSNPIYYGLYQQNITLSYNNNGRGTAPAAQTGTRYTNSYSIGSVINPTFKIGTSMSSKDYLFLGWYESKYKSSPMNYYADTYNDLKTKFGYDQKLLMENYYNYGKKEGRRIGQHLSGEQWSISSSTILYGGWYMDLARIRTTKEINSPANQYYGDGDYTNSYFRATKIPAYFDLTSLNVPNNNYGNIQFSGSWNGEVFRMTRTAINGDEIIAFTSKTTICNYASFLKSVSVEGYSIIVDCKSISNYKNMNIDNFLFDFKSVNIPSAATGKLVFTKKYDSSTGTLTISRNGIVGNGAISFSVNIFYWQ